MSATGEGAIAAGRKHRPAGRLHADFLPGCGAMNPNLFRSDFHKAKRRTIMIRFASRTAVVLFLMIVISASVHAQATRTWVSGVGDDVNPCSRTAPCKTFAGAISKTMAGEKFLSWIRVAMALSLSLKR